MKRYKDWSPSQFDTKGLGCEDRADWFVAPVIRTRDSGPLEESNFQSTLHILASKLGAHEVHRFGHWACGWFEIILVEPGTGAAQEAEAIEAALANYPIVDEDDFSERELEAAYEAWAQMSRRERIRLLAKRHISIFAARSDSIPERLDFCDLVEL